MAAKPKLTINIREKDLGFKHFLREAAKLRQKPFVKAGVTQKKGSRLHEGSTKTVADILAIHEFGAPDQGIPERAPLRTTRNKNQSKYDAHINKLRDQIFDANSGMTTEKALALIGQEYVADVKRAIRDGLPPPLKPATVRRKNAGEIGKARSFLGAGGSAKDFTKSGQARISRAENLVNTGGDSTPLIDTAQTINSIAYEVVMSGQESGSGTEVDE